MTKNNKLTFETYIVVRDNGRIAGMRKKTKSFGIKQAKALYSSSGSISENLRRYVLSKVIEIEDTRRNARPAKGRSFQGIASARIGARPIIARSMQYPAGSSISEAKQEALENLYRIIGAYVEGYSDAATGERIVREDELSLSVGVVYYTPRTASA